MICHCVMRKLFFAFALLPCVALLVGCPKKKDDGLDGGEDGSAEAAADVVDAAPAAPVAKNAADIARFPAAEKPVTDDTSPLVDFNSPVRTTPRGGSVVANLKAGVDPVKIAEHQDCFLVTFPDPKDPAATLMGWIGKDAFIRDAVVDAGIKDAAKDAVVADAAPVPAGPLKCPAGQEVIVNIGPAPLCKKKCTSNKDCKNPVADACHVASTLGGKTTKVCAAETP